MPNLIDPHSERETNENKSFSLVSLLHLIYTIKIHAQKYSFFHYRENHLLNVYQVFLGHYQ